MNKLYRIIDANINRVSEGIRVLEDLARFYYHDCQITEQLKHLRHQVRKTIAELQYTFLEQRNSQRDLGLSISQSNDLDNKKNLRDLISSNFKRVQEGLRVVEETLKVAGFYNESKIFEERRYDAYNIEKLYLSKISRTEKAVKLKSDLYCLTAEEHSNGRDNICVVKEMIAANVKIIQYREKDKGKLSKLNECKEIRKLTKEADVIFIVNDDIDIAILVQADGIHIGQEDLPIEAVRELVGEDMIIGVSTHSPAQAQNAIIRGADYIGVGPIYKTFTKKDVCDPVGLEYLEYAVGNVTIPFVAIGGIKEQNVAEVSKCGAKCIAMVTEIVGAENIKEKIDNIRKIIFSNTFSEERSRELYNSDGCR